MADDHTIRTPEDGRIHVQEVHKDVQVREVRPGELRDQPLEVRKSDAERMTEREAARARLRASVDVLAERANLQLQMQKEPLKMIGGASAVGAVLGLVLGRQMRRSKKIYVDADSPAKQQKALVKAQKKQGGTSVGGALVAAVVPLAMRVITDKFVTPKLEELSTGLLDRAANPGAPKLKVVKETKAGSAVYVTPAAQGVVTPHPVVGTGTVGTGRPADAFLKRSVSSTAPAAEERVAESVTVPATGVTPSPKAEAPQPVTRVEHVSAHPSQVTLPATSGPQAQNGPVNPIHPGVVRMPESRVEAKAAGTPLSERERTNPGDGTRHQTARPGTGPTGPVVTPTHAGVVRMPESVVEAQAVGTPIDEAGRSNPNTQAQALKAAGAGTTGPTGPVVTPTHAGVVRMPESIVEAQAVGTPIDETGRSNPNRR